MSTTNCLYPLYRIDYERCRLWLPIDYEKRVRNKGIIVNPDEAEFIKWKYPNIANYVNRIPCGKCVNCRLNYSRQWANRCYLEAKQYENNMFLTLTYDNAHLKFYKDFVDPETGEITRYKPVLDCDDLQRFLKRYRKRFGDGIRFFGCGEYGEQTLRPHYHLLVFNHSLPDVKFYSKRDGFQFYTSELLDSSWKNGNCIVGDLTWESCAYVSRYVMKKQKGKGRQDLLKYNPGYQDEFVRMSRKPGIARAYLEENAERLAEDREIFVQRGLKTVKAGLPRYFKDYLDKDLSETDKLIKRVEFLTNFERQLRAELAQTDLTEYDYNRVIERVKERQIKQLRRPNN